MDLKPISLNLCFKEVQQGFIDDVRPKYIMPTLLKLGVITNEEEKELKASLSREDKVRKLIDFVLTKNAKQMNNFVKALREDENGDSPYPWLADALERKKELSVETHKTLVNGNIPFPINHFVEREMLHTIRNDLKEASNRGRWWVTLHGPFGSGKTVIAAEAVRDNELVEKIFPGGIYWIYFSYFQEDKSPEFEAEKIKEQMKSLFVWMQSDVELHREETIMNLRLCLRNAVVERKKTLIILDSVGSSKVISAFDIGCPVLVTTTHEKVMIPANRFVTLRRIEDLDEQETLNLISLYTEIPLENAATAKNLAKKCGGSPLMATLLSLRLADLGTSLNMWKEFDQKLEKQGTDTVRRRHSSGDYNHDLETLVRDSLKSIEDREDYFYDFLVFSKDIPVPSEILEILWDLGPLEVMEIMNDLHHRCFVEKVKTAESECPSYIAHYLDILKKDKTDDWLKERHKRLIEKLNISPSGDIDLTLFSKNYIPMALCYHLSKAGEYGLLENVCLNLRYVEQKIHITEDPEHLYMDYHLNKHMFEHPEHVQQFEEFVRKNASSICKKVDIFQLALFEPESSIVYQKAKNHISFNSGLYYNWCNKKDLHFNCKIRGVPAERAITHAAINSDGSLVAVVMHTYGEVYELDTGALLMKLTGHGEKVTYCAFNSKGDEICTASEDTNVKIFEVDKSMVKSNNTPKRQMSCDFIADISEMKASFTFKEHRGKVNCCEFAPDDQSLISCDQLGIVLVWEIAPSNTTSIILRKVKMGRPLKTLSCFSWDGTSFAAYSVNSIKVWKTDASKEEDTPVLDLDLESPIHGFCFSEDSKSVFFALSDNIYRSDVPGGDLQSVLKSHHSKDYVINCCCLSPDGNYLAYGTSPPSVIVVNVHSRHVVAYFQGHNAPVDHAKFSEDGKILLSVSENRYMIHDVSNLKNKPIANFAKNLSVRVDQEDSLLIASSNFFNRIEVRKGYDGTLFATTEEDEESNITACSISYDCKEVIYGNMKGFVKVFNLDDKSVGCFQKHVDRITFILHSKVNPPCFFTCSEDRTIKIWKEKEDPLTLKGHISSVLMCAEFKKGDRILSCSKDGTMKVWNTETGEILVNMDDGHGNADVRFCDISLPDENLLASASSDETVKIWKSLNGELKREFKECDLNASVKCCRFLEKLQILVSGHDNGKVKIWSLHAKVKEPLVPHEKHDSVVYNILCHGKRLLTISNDIKLWDYDLLLKNIVLPSSSVGDAPPYVWASDNFNDIVVIINKVLYILRRIP